MCVPAEFGRFHSFQSERPNFVWNWQEHLGIGGRNFSQGCFVSDFSKSRCSGRNGTEHNGIDNSASLLLHMVEFQVHERNYFVKSHSMKTSNNCFSAHKSTWVWKKLRSKKFKGFCIKNHQTHNSENCVVCSLSNICDLSINCSRNNPSTVVFHYFLESLE